MADSWGAHLRRSWQIAAQDATQTQPARAPGRGIEGHRNPASSGSWHWPPQGRDPSTAKGVRENFARLGKRGRRTRRRLSGFRQLRAAAAAALLGRRGGDDVRQSAVDDPGGVAESTGCRLASSRPGALAAGASGGWSSACARSQRCSTTRPRQSTRSLTPWPARLDRDRYHAMRSPPIPVVDLAHEAARRYVDTFPLTEVARVLLERSGVPPSRRSPVRE
jgi:hypothetical protein